MEGTIIQVIEKWVERLSLIPQEWRPRERGMTSRFITHLTLNKINLRNTELNLNRPRIYKTHGDQISIKIRVLPLSVYEVYTEYIVSKSP